MTPNSSIPVSLLYNGKLLRCLLGKRIDGRDGLAAADGDELDTRSAYRLYAQREFQVSFQRQDNAIFDSRWTYFCQEYPWEELTGPVLSALRAIHDEYLDERDRGMHVKLERFGEWQNLLANICYQPLAAYSAQRRRDYSRELLLNSLRDKDEHKRYQALIQASPLCYPYEIAVEDYIRDKGLNDAHLHINACGFTEYSWVYALRYPQKAFREVEGKRSSEALQQQFIEICGVPPTRDLLQHLNIARNIRTILRNHAESSPNYTHYMYSGPALTFFKVCLPSHRIGQLAEVEVDPLFAECDWESESYSSIIRRERAWLSLLINDLLNPENHRHKVWLIRLFHVYLLLMNEYCNLFAQKESQKGFSQFSNTQQLPNALSWHKKYYFECFQQFHGARKDSDVHYLDARIAAKPVAKHNVTQIIEILRDYYRYLQWSHCSTVQPGRRFRDAFPGHLRPNELIDNIRQLVTHSSCRVIHMNLTAHFIKKPWEWKDEEDAYRYHSYRKELVTCCKALASNFQQIRGLEHIFNSVDAANDEQFVPPSVFAPCFRHCRHELRMVNITFHCGEDFRHLLTGIRVLNDAMLCLDLRQGDRIGHGTAVGMSPKHWRRSVPRTLYIKKEDRMLDLLFAFRILKLRPDVPSKTIRHMQDELLNIAHELFDSHVPSVDEPNLQMAMELRKLDPGLLLSIFGRTSTEHMPNIFSFKQSPLAYTLRHFPEYDERIHEHHITMSCLKQSSPLAIKLILAWFTQKSIWKEGQKVIPIDISKENDELYCLLQQHIMKEFYERRIIIETLMSSNLRIACYGQASQHHSMRWLLHKPAPFSSDPKVLLAFGSDDPAIFSCDAKSEFYLLYASLREHGITEHDAICLLDEVNNRGRIYSFGNSRHEAHA